MNERLSAAPGTVVVELKEYIYNKLCALMPKEEPSAVMSVLVLREDELKQKRKYDTLPVKCRVCGQFRQYRDCVPLELMYEHLLKARGDRYMDGICRKCEPTSAGGSDRTPAGTTTQERPPGAARKKE
jgi:hypothetical protein